MQSNNNCDTESIRLWELYSEITATTHSHNINQHKVSYYTLHTYREHNVLLIFHWFSLSHIFLQIYFCSSPNGIYTLHHLYAVYINICVCYFFLFSLDIYRMWWDVCIFVSISFRFQVIIDLKYGVGDFYCWCILYAYDDGI